MLNHERMNMAKQLMLKGQEIVGDYISMGDQYNSLITRVNIADSKMSLGDLLTAEKEMYDVYIDAKRSLWKQAYNIASIGYANVLTCLGKSSVALSYYEEGIGVSVELNHQWDALYGRIWRTLALTNLGEPSALVLVNECKDEAEREEYGYLAQLALTFEIIENYILNIPLSQAELDRRLEGIHSSSAPGLRLEALYTSLLIIDMDEKSTCEYVNEIYDLIEVCEGVKGRPDLLKILYTNKKCIFNDENKNISLEEWILKYIDPYIADFVETEELLFADLPERPLLRSCDMEKCAGYCCYDGVYLGQGEETMIQNFIKDNQKEFSVKAEDCFENGTWVGVDKERKTSVKAFKYGNDFPNHFEQTKCSFSDDIGLCKLQLVSTQLHLHPWKIKPRSCWLFPLSIEGGKVIPPPKKGEADRMYVDETYPGYVSYLQCGQKLSEGISWRIVFKQELLYYRHLKQQEELI